MNTKLTTVALVAILALAASVAMAEMADSGYRPCPMTGQGPAIVPPEQVPPIGQGPALKGDHEGYGGMDWGVKIEVLTKQLKLTPDQVAHFKQHHADFMSETQAARDDLRVKRQQMVELWKADKPDGTAIKALAADIERDRALIRDAGIDHMIAGLSVLTPDQRAKLRTMAEQWFAKHGKMRGCPAVE